MLARQPNAQLPHQPCMIATAHNITFLEVPMYGDPHQEANLVCHYMNDQGDPALHSVKWYRGSNEIFRFTPGQQPPTRTFNSTAGGVSRGSCNLNSCAISVVLPRNYNTKLSFTCEVSTEGPRFAVVKQTKELTVAVTLKEDPVISGVPGTVQLGEDVLLNCTTKPAMPPANIVWYIDGRPDRTDFGTRNNNTPVSNANDFNLRSSWRAIRLRVATSRGFMALRCEAIQPMQPPYIRATNATLVVARSPHLSMFTAAGSSSTMLEATVLILTLCISVHIFSKYSALSEV
uniref:SFRICE_024959 n=1 Tax=Spodoptera frugiperda TaxID=7108 RepID=A0A2H1VEZ0_SPOFR